MLIPDGYHEIQKGRIAAIVTYLEMRQQPTGMDATIPQGLEVRRIMNPDSQWYRDLFRAVGEHWLWFSRLIKSDAELTEILHDPRVELYVLFMGAAPKGLLELDLREPPDIELTFFGLTSDWIGRGAGRYLMQHGIRQAFRHHPPRLYLHTCTLDHPEALAFYRKAGFHPYQRVIEVARDPRLNGDADPSAAPQVPIL